MDAIVLCAGKGTRMKPVSDIYTKPMIPVANIPFLDFVVYNLESAGAKNICFITNKENNKQIKNYFGNKYSYSIQKKQLGTADAISYAEKYVSEKFIVLNGDNLFNTDALKRFIAYSERVKGHLIGVKSVPNPEKYGVIITAKDGTIKKIVEKPSNPQTKLINTGIYCFEPDIFDSIRETPLSSRKEYEITDSIFIGSQRVFPAYITGKWIDFGMPWNILEVSIYVINNFRKRIYRENLAYSYIKTRISTTSTCVFRELPEIGSNSHIKYYSSLDRDISIGDNTRIYNSVIYRNVSIGDNCQIYNSIICPDAVIENNTVINHRLNHKKTVKMIINGKKYDTGRINIGAIIGPGIKIKKNSVLEAGSILSL